MTGSEALTCIQSLGFKVILKGDKPLIVPHPEGKEPPPELVTTLKANRDEVIASLSGKSDTQAVIAPQGMSLDELMRRHFIPRREFVPGIVAQGVTLLASKAKIGKTWLTLNIGLALASGGMAFGKIAVEKVGVLILSLEDGPQRLQDRFALLLEETKPPDNLHIFTEWPRLDAGGTAQLDEYLTEHPA